MGPVWGLWGLWGSTGAGAHQAGIPFRGPAEPGTGPAPQLGSRGPDAILAIGGNPSFMAATSDFALPAAGRERR